MARSGEIRSQRTTRPTFHSAMGFVESYNLPRPVSHGVRLENYRFCPPCGGALELKTVKEGEPPRLVCAGCGFIFYLDPKVAACTITMLNGGIVLLKRAIEPQLGK